MAFSYRKYGVATSGGKKKGKKRKFDFQDYGLGYDETDPFVDNSEACDEVTIEEKDVRHEKHVRKHRGV